MYPASFAPVGFDVASGVAFPRFGLSVSTKNVHFSDICPPKRIRIRRRNTFFDSPVVSGVSSSSSCGCARNPILMVDLPSLLSTSHWARAGEASTINTIAAESAAMRTVQLAVASRLIAVSPPEWRRPPGGPRFLRSNAAVAATSGGRDDTTVLTTHRPVIDTIAERFNAKRSLQGPWRRDGGWRSPVRFDHAGRPGHRDCARPGRSVCASSGGSGAACAGDSGLSTPHPAPGRRGVRAGRPRASSSPKCTSP